MNPNFSGQQFKFDIDPKEDIIHVEVWNNTDDEKEDYILGKGQFLLD